MSVGPSAMAPTHERAAPFNRPCVADAAFARVNTAPRYVAGYTFGIFLGAAAKQATERKSQEWFERIFFSLDDLDHSDQTNPKIFHAKTI